MSLTNSKSFFAGCLFLFLIWLFSILICESRSDEVVVSCFSLVFFYKSTCAEIFSFSVSWKNNYLFLLSFLLSQIFVLYWLIKQTSNYTLGEPCFVVKLYILFFITTFSPLWLFGFSGFWLLIRCHLITWVIHVFLFVFEN